MRNHKSNARALNGAAVDSPALRDAAANDSDDSERIVAALTSVRDVRQEILRREVLENGRIDVLATEGLEFPPFDGHLKIEG